MQPQQPQQPQQQPFIMNIQQNAGPQGYAPPPPAPAYAPPPAPIVIQQNKQGKSYALICCILVVLAIIVIVIVNVIYASMGPGFPVQDICELDGQTFHLTENIILTEPEVNPDEYEHNKNCVVTITVPDRQISLEFEHFHVGESFFGCDDWLKIGDDTFCGYSDPGFLQTDSGFNQYQEYSTDMQSLTFEWYTNDNYADQGFRVILKHKDSENAPDFFDNSNGFRALLAASQKNKEE